MKTYKGERLKEGCEVYVTEEGKRYPLPMHLEIRNHSPSGFEWGYGGSGPAQLALALLADHIGPDPSPAVCPFCESAMKDWKCSEPECNFDGNHKLYAEEYKWLSVAKLYQDFKAEIVAALDDRWEIDSAALDRWIAGRKVTT